MPDSSLSWRVPTTGDPRLLRLALAQVGLASIVAAMILFVAAPREWLVPALLGLIPLAIFMAYRRWSAYRRSLEGKDNVRIDERGVHWRDAGDEERTFRRDEIVGFQIGHHSDTLRPVPALTLHLSGGLESQPIELHPPATIENVRTLLGEAWGIGERTQSADNHYDALAHVYSECHEEYQEWHWEGARDDLGRFFALVAAAADELPSPLPGVKPAERIVLANRRETTRLRLARAAAAHFDADTLAAPAEVLRDIAARAAEALSAAGETADARFDVPLGSRKVWTFHLHVRGSAN
jgi:hypothetical protein